ncbi:DNA-3-methyladenine glycosylase [Janibacter sp. YB324]|uniref:DNA-3-methyladenine glycosylase n=1 Tax=Janibacter sp. YB324 TaxID=2761047 RepID=UPI0016288E38|nr:DNA-3-methyladenine glycosylase [Janibacter sp. YB324]QNF92991.1 DNA-3-methyladenine glycosylase [Janibacter sp. YB324]
MTTTGRRLTGSDLAGDPLSVAPMLLGTRLVAGDVTLRLTEVEAYWGGNDPGSHGYRGMTPRTEVMFGPAGHLYVYRSYGIHWCANVVVGSKGECAAVLLRAGEVVRGEETARDRRGDVRARDLARGPGRLTRALGLTGEHDGSALVGSRAPIALVAPDEPVDPQRIRTGPRVGVSGPGGDGADYPWRFWLDGEPTVSAYRPGKPRVRRG